MLGFNDQQRGRGCILAAMERRKECRDGGGKGGGRKKGARQANNAGRKKARGKNCASDLSEDPRGSEPREPPMVSVIGGH